MISGSTLQKIKQYAFKTDWDDAFGGASKGNQHLERVVRIAKYIAKAESADIPVVIAGALLHDISLPTGDDYDYDTNKKHAHKELQRFNLAPQEEDAIIECIASHEGTAPPKTMEAEIVHDADTLEKSGILGLIRHTWKLVHLGAISSKAVGDDDVRTIYDHVAWRGSRLHSSTAKRLHAAVSVNVSDAQAQNIIKEAARMAAQRFITEVIAQKLMPSLDKNQQEHLSAQLDLSYLYTTS